MDKMIRKMIPAEFKIIYKSIELDFAEGEYAPYDVLSKQLEKGMQGTVSSWALAKFSLLGY